MRIDCRDCVMKDTAQCDDCLVTVLLHPPEDSVEIPDELESSLGTLASEGLVPVLKFRPREPGPDREGRAPGDAQTETG